MNWKLARQLLWLARVLDEGDEPDGAEICREAAHEIEIMQTMLLREPVELPIEEGDRANG